MTILDQELEIKKDVQRDAKKSYVHQIDIDVKGNRKQFNVLAESVEDAVADFKRYVFDTERIIEGKNYQIVQMAGGYYKIDYISKFWRKKNAYKTIRELFSQEEKDKLINDLQAEKRVKK